jgi:hypothetical protein
MDWLAVVDGMHLPNIWHGLAEVPLPSPNAVGQVDLLRQQLEFLAKENARQGAEFAEKRKLLADENQKLSESFTDAQETAKSAVTRQVEERMGAIADNRIDLVRRSLEREVVVDKARVEYWLLGVQTPPKEFGLLEKRGFQQIRFCDRDGQQSRRRDVDVVVLDLNNWCDAQGTAFGALTKAEQELKVKEQLDLVTSGVAGRSMVFVVFVTGRYDCLDEAGKTYLVTATNNPVTLVGTVVDAAYLAAGEA